MDNTDEKMNSYSKVPYDNEPISRSSSYQRKTTKTPMGSNKFLMILMSLVIIVNIFMGVALINLYSKNNLSDKVVNYNNYSIPVDVNTSNSNLNELSNMLAVTKIKQSAVIVSAGNPSSMDDPYTSSDDITKVDTKYEFFSMKNHGSGVITHLDKNSGEAYITTCYHVISGNTSQVAIMIYDSLVPILAKTVGYSSKNDIAVLKIESQQLIDSNCKAAEIADSSTVVMGETAHTVGNPYNSDFRSSTGTVTSPEGLVPVGNNVYRVIGTDTPINPGNSGGGLFNAKGELIGIVNAKTQSDTIDNMAYAIPSNLAISLANNIIRNNYPVQATIGVSLAVRSGIIDTEVINGRELFDYEVLVTKVESGSAAEKAGIKVGDEIVSFTYSSTYVKCRSQYSFADHAFNLNVGDKVQVVVNRGGEQLILTVTVSKVVAADSI